MVRRWRSVLQARVFASTVAFGCGVASTAHAQGSIDWPAIEDAPLRPAGGLSRSGDPPRLFFMHFWANDDAVNLACGLRAALDHTNSLPGSHL